MDIRNSDKIVEDKELIKEGFIDKSFLIKEEEIVKSKKFRDSLLYNLIEKQDKFILSETKMNMQLYNEGGSSFAFVKSNLHIPFMFESFCFYIGY